MSLLVLELNSEGAAALSQAALLQSVTTQQFVKKALADYLETRPSTPSTDDVQALAESIQRPVLSGGIRKDLSPEQAQVRRAEAKSRMPGFGLLEGKLQVDGVAVADGVEYQNRMRDAWRRARALTPTSSLII